MRWFSAGAGSALVGILILTSLGSVGCKGMKEYEDLNMKNREQETLLAERNADLARLNERVEALMARGGDAQKLLDDKIREVQQAKGEKDALLKAFNDLRDAYIKLAEQRTGRPGGLPGPVADAIQQLQRRYPDLIIFDKEKGRVRFNADITFDSGSNVVKPDAKGALTKLAQILNEAEAKALVLTIVGHTDTDPVKKPQTIALLKGIGKRTDNMGLSEARAEAVAEVLKGAGIDAARMVTQGKGQTEPIADNRTAGGKAKNRRVEIYLTPGAAPTAPPPAAPKAPAAEK